MKKLFACLLVLLTLLFSTLLLDARAAEEGIISFTTFEELKALESQTFNTATQLRYVGTEPLVISEALTLPENVTSLEIRQETSSGRLEVSKNVTFHTKACISTDVAVVKGTLVCDLLQVYKELDADAGSVRAEKAADLYGNGTVLKGAYNVHSSGSLNWHWTVDTGSAQQMKEILTNARDQGYLPNVFVITCPTDIVIDRDIIIYSNAILNLNAGVTMTIAEGAELRMAGTFRVCGTLNVEGKLSGNHTADIYYDDGGRMVVTQNGTNTGSLRVISNQQQFPVDAISGIVQKEYAATRLEEETPGWLLTYLGPNDPEKTGIYPFSSYEEIKTLADKTYDAPASLYYLGPDPLVIQEDLTLPGNVVLYVRKDYSSGSLVIPEGVTLNASDNTAGTPLTVTDVQVRGVLKCSYLEFYQSMDITGKVHLYYDGIYMQDGDATFSGGENIVYEDDLCGVYFLNDWRQDLKRVAETAAFTKDPRWVYVYFVNEPMSVTGTLEIPSNMLLYVRQRLTVEEGGHLILNSMMTVQHTVDVNGVLENRAAIDIYYDEGGEMSFRWGTYTGIGTIYVNSDTTTDYQAAIPDISLRDYAITQHDAENGYPRYWEIVYQGPQEWGYRIAGANRFQTAFLVAEEMKEKLGVEKFDTIVIASGTNFADALSGSYLAAINDAPILLCYHNVETVQRVRSYVHENLKPGGTVYILGGRSAVPDYVEVTLDQFVVKRLAGANRFETNLMILEEAGVGDKPVLVCTGLSFADSLSASASKLPILLVWNDLTEGQTAFLEGLSGDNQLYVIGGETAVSTGMEEQVAAYGDVKRIGGSNRFETSVMIAEEFFETPKSAVLAYAWNYPDGLCGGPLAAVLDVPLLLTMNGYGTAADAYAQKVGIAGGVVLGGENLISDQLAAEIFTAE